MSQPTPPAPGPADQPESWFSPRAWFRGSSNTDQPEQSPASDADAPAVSGSYRFCRGVPLNPQQGIHPELEDPGEGGGFAPRSPEELIRMQRRATEQSRPQKSAKGEKPSPKVQKVLDCWGKQELSPAEDKTIALAILGHLEQFHDETVEEMVNADDSKRSLLAAWAVDADRLMLCRIFLEGIEL